MLGGPIGVYETDGYPFLFAEIDVLERRLSRGQPTLGIRLGRQLMARALDARVFPGQVNEIGWGSVELTEAGALSSLSPLADEAARILHWHGDTFDLPPEAIRLTTRTITRIKLSPSENRRWRCSFHIEADPARPRSVAGRSCRGTRRRQDFACGIAGRDTPRRGQGKHPGMADFCGLAVPYRA
jgi:GMP synthase (glutamine-hydrolysing)